MGYWHHVLITLSFVYFISLYPADAGDAFIRAAAADSLSMIDDERLHKAALAEVMQYVVSARFKTSPVEHERVWTQQVSPAFWRLYNIYDLIGAADDDMIKLVALVRAKSYCGAGTTVASHLRDMFLKTFTYVLLNQEKLNESCLKSYQELMRVYFDARVLVVQTEIELAEVLQARDLYLVDPVERQKKIDEQLKAFYDFYDHLFKA